MSKNKHYHETNCIERDCSINIEYLLSPEDGQPLECLIIDFSEFYRRPRLTRPGDQQKVARLKPLGDLPIKKLADKLHKSVWRGITLQVFHDPKFEIVERFIKKLNPHWHYKTGKKPRYLPLVYSDKQDADDDVDEKGGRGFNLDDIYLNRMFLTGFDQTNPDKKIRPDNLKQHFSKLKCVEKYKDLNFTVEFLRHPHTGEYLNACLMDIEDKSETFQEIDVDEIVDQAQLSKVQGHKSGVKVSVERDSDHRIAKDWIRGLGFGWGPVSVRSGV